MLLYDAVIFDLDGTLTDSQPGIFACTEYALKKMGLPVPPESTLRRFLGPPLADSYMKYCGMTEEQASYATDLYRERYIPIGWKENKVYPRIRALLSELKKRGAYLAVATGKPQQTSVDILRYFDLLKYFDAVAGPTPEELHINKADLIRRVLPKGKKAVMVGDIAGDIIGAQDAGIASIAALYGYGEKSETLAANPTHAVETTQALCDLLCPGMKNPKGFFVTLEGMDGCGKSTQAAALQERLEQFGYTVRRTREQHVQEVILPAIERGEIVLCDRFADSSPVDRGMARSLDWVKEINQAASREDAPGANLYFKMSNEKAMARHMAASQPDRIEKAGDTFHDQTEAGFEELARQYPERFIPVNVDQSPEEATEEAFAKLFQRMQERGVL